MALANANVLIVGLASNGFCTGASMGIGQEIARSIAQAGANLVLFSRSEDKLANLVRDISTSHPRSKVIYRAVDVGNHEAIESSVKSAIEEIGDIDILINNVGHPKANAAAGLALGAPSSFHDLKIQDIITMNSTNVSGLMYTTYAVLNASMMKHPNRTSTILNITSTTALEAPPFPGEAVYHANKALQEGFTNALRNELSGTNIKVLALRPGVVATHFHRQRVNYDDDKYDGFIEGFTPLEARDVAQAAVYMLSQPDGISVKALDIVPSAQRSLNVFDRSWNERNSQNQS